MPGCRVISQLLLLGATGDLAGRFLLPALAGLQAAGGLPAGLQVVGAAPQPWDDVAFRAHVAARTGGHPLLEALRYRRVDLEQDPGAVQGALSALGAGPVAVYLALPPDRAVPAVRALASAGLPAGSRVALEKPFGTDRVSAAALNALLEDVGGEEAVYRVDHVLAMPTTQELVAQRWSGEQVEQVELLWEETIALEGRADFYDRAGAVRDVVQNHLLQVLALLAMEPPSSDDVHERRLDVLRAARAAGPGRRARYGAGRLAGGARVPAYADEEGVDPARGTETAAELVLELALPRWSGTRVVLRAGKALQADRKGVLLTLRGGRQRWVELDDPTAAGRGELAAYTAVLAELLGGGSSLSVSGAEAEQAWAVVEPVLAAWARDEVPLVEHEAGTPPFA